MIVLHSALSPEVVAETLRREMDEERWTLFSLSGLAGDRPVVGKVEGEQFRLRKRVYLHNDFAGQFYGSMTGEPGGTRMEGYFDFPRWIRYFMRGWLALAILICVPIFALTVFDLALGVHFIAAKGSDWLGLVVAPAFLAYALLLPWVGRRLGRGGERYILNFLETKLGARVEGQSLSNAEQRSISR
jgi:hypothetical protein